MNREPSFDNGQSIIDIIHCCIISFIAHNLPYH